VKEGEERGKKHEKKSKAYLKLSPPPILESELPLVRLTRHSILCCHRPQLLDLRPVLVDDRVLPRFERVERGGRDLMPARVAVLDLPVAVDGDDTDGRDGGKDGIAFCEEEDGLA
jgi:hypothetical protein